MNENQSGLPCYNVETSRVCKNAFMTSFVRHLAFNSLACAITSTFALIAGTAALNAQVFSGNAVPVPNGSFESPTAPMSPPYVNTMVDSWEKPTEPAYYDAAIGTPFGIPWEGTAGVFFDTNPYANHDGTQAAYLLGFPQVALFQDYDSTPTHEFDATYQVGYAYTLAVGIFGKNLAPGSTLEVSLYYRDGSNAKIMVGSQTVVYSMMTFPTNLPLSLVDFTVDVPVVQASDAWAGQHIGIQLESTTPLQLSTGGNWDFDNISLTSVPEPSSLGLLVLGGVLLARGRVRRKQARICRGNHESVDCES